MAELTNERLAELRHWLESELAHTQQSYENNQEHHEECLQQVDLEQIERLNDLLAVVYEYATMDKDAALGRLVRHMPEGYYLRYLERNVNEPGKVWQVGHNNYPKPWDVCERTPEHALTKAIECVMTGQRR
jgi:hypothetical protein